MDKLKKILVYQFWILLVVVLALPLVGWSMARTGYISEAASRKDLVEKAFTSIPSGTENPNDSWTNALEEMNKKQEGQVTRAWLAIWERQKPLMTWPAGMESDPAKATARDREVYRGVYRAEIEKTRNILRPLVDETEGLVDFPYDRMPAEDWGNLSPTVEQVLDAQEDLWMLSALFTAIAAVNRDSRVQYEAPIRELYEIYLRGGNGKPGTVTAAPPGGTGPPDAASAPGGPPAAAMPDLGGRMPSGRAGSGGISSVDFDPTDEFGDDKISAGGTGPQGNTQSMPAMADIKAAAPTKLRYVQDNDKWKTRGFYMKLAIDHRRLPDLLATLANQKWPIRVLRVQQVDLHPEDLGDAGASSPAPGGGISVLPAGGAPGGLLGVPGVAGGSPFDSRSQKVTTMASANSAMADPMLAMVALDGLITIFKSPPPEVLAQASSPATPEATAPAGTPASSAAGPATAPAAVPATTPAASPAPPAPGATPASAAGGAAPAEPPPAPN